MRLDMIRSIQPEGNKGFTLIEVLITMAIFSIGVLAVASMQYWSVRNTASGNIMTTGRQFGSSADGNTQERT